MQIVGLTVSLNYADYLEHTIKSLVNNTDILYVVTSKNDGAWNLSLDYGASTIEFNDWHINNASFNKSGAVSCGQRTISSLHPDSWKLLIDSDIYLPDDTKQIILENNLSDNCIYGAKRKDYHSIEDFVNNNISNHYEHDYAGFFQLYRANLYYDTFSTSCAECDLSFVCKFCCTKILPITVYHLGRDNVNWNGRTSTKWNKE